MARRQVFQAVPSGPTQCGIHRRVEAAGYTTLMLTVDTAVLVPQVTWGTNPGQVVPVTGRVPDPAALDAPADRESAERALAQLQSTQQQLLQSEKFASLGGRIPFSTDGGLTARGHPGGPTGLAQIHETVLQLRGGAGSRQVEGARTGLCHMAGAGSVCVVHILQRT